MSVFESDKRLIEVDFPLKEVSEESVREKNIRHGIFQPSIFGGLDGH